MIDGDDTHSTDGALLFHPAVQRWFATQFAAPTPAQCGAWPTIASGRNALIAAPTGSGKTLAAFLAAIDTLVREAVAGRLEDATQVVYVSPLKALSNDIHRNLEQPLAGITAELERLGLPSQPLRALVRTGDTPPAARVEMSRRPPHILVTTPESLYLLLTSESGRRLLGSVRSVIVDEIHAVAGSKRGAHLALSLERLAALSPHPLQRIGLSATVKPIEQIARFLVGAAPEGSATDCAIVDSGHVLVRDLALLLPDAPLEAVMSADVWQNLYDQLAQLIQQHRTTLIFANTRRMVERVARHLSERIGEQHLAAHHGSLAKEQRLDAEQRLKTGRLRALVATSSLELGIDIGDVELVCQLGTPRSISTFLQRVGRANHAVGGVPKGRLLPLSRDELIECTALLDAVRAGELDALHIPPQPLDVLAQQLVAEVSAREWDEDALYTLVRRAWPYRELERAQFDELVRMLADGFATRRGRQSAYLHRDAVHRQLRARRGARLTAITCGGAIPDTADYQVVLEPSGTFIGTLNEDFAVESLSGDVFQLGNCSYRILRVEAGRVRVEDARGQPPTMPFWLGEAPARSTELSAAVSALREEIDTALATVDATTIARCIEQTVNRHELSETASRQLVEYLAASKAMLGRLPTQRCIAVERFFDETGDMHLVIHAPFGSRINRALGLTLRKRFCRAFNFELQAAATEDAIVLSLGETHSFALDELPRFLNSASAERVLEQAVLDAPLFITRWRWNASIALAVRRARAGKKVPAPLQRMAAEDLLAVVFPDQLACAENVQGEREIPDHPLVRQTLYDCLHEAMDIEGLRALLSAIEQGRLQVIARDLPQPSPLALEVLSARPYAYLDDAPLEERRTQAVAARRWIDPEVAAQFGQLDAGAIDAVRAEAWPAPESEDELHDALMSLAVINEAQDNVHGMVPLLERLIAERRATRLRTAAATFWVAAEQLPLAFHVYPNARLEPQITAPPEYDRVWDSGEAVRELLRNRLQAAGPVTSERLAATLALTGSRIEAGLLALEHEGFVLRGRFTPGHDELEWCERRLLARIHRYTLKTLRAEIEPVAVAAFMRFLLQWQGLTREPRPEGVDSLEGLIEQLEGFAVPAAAWEADVLPARLKDYDAAWLDSLCLSGRAYWSRLTVPESVGAGPVRSTPIALLTRKRRSQWQQLLSSDGEPQPALSAGARAIAEHLQQFGASFFDELRQGAGLLPAQAESALAELVAAGLATSDSFAGLRALLLPLERKRKLAARGRRIALFGLQEAGRWSLIHRSTGAAIQLQLGDELQQSVAWLLLRRYGVVFKRVLAREGPWVPPWHALLRVYRRLEAQGHIRGGRFVAGVSGEQFALPDAIGTLRSARSASSEGRCISLSACDPLNLTGSVIPGARVPALASNRLLLQDGIPVAAYIGGSAQFLTSLSPPEQWRVRSLLLRRSSARAPARTY